METTEALPVSDKPNALTKNPYLVALVIIFIFAFSVRFYYLSLTLNQPLWWDESEYMVAAKSYAGIVDYQLSSMRLPGFPLLVSGFYMAGLTNEAFLRTVMAFIPSLLVILLLFLCINEMYPDRRIALISTAIFAVLWEHVFYSNRFHTENFALIFQFLAFLVLFRGYIKKKDTWIIKPKYALIWIALFSVISVFFRPGNMPFVPAVFLFILILDRKKIFSRKAMPFLTASIVIAAILLFSFFGKFSTLLSTYYHPQNPLAWNTLTIFYGFYQSIVPWLPSILFYSFLFGVFLFIIDFAIKFETIKGFENNTEHIELKSDFFNSLVLLSVLFVFIFLIRSWNGLEYRWFFPLLASMLVMTSKGIIVFSEYAGSFLNSKKAISLIIIAITVLGVYAQLVHADSIVKYKIDSYKEVKEIGLWIKENSGKDDKVISASQPQNAYYSERFTYNFFLNGMANSEEEFNGKLNETKPRYMVISVFEPNFTPKWVYDWPQRNNETVRPVHAIYAGEDNQQVIAIIYEFNSFS